MATKQGTKKSKPKTAARGLIQWKRIEAPLSGLRLDLENPRHEPAKNEDEVIAWLYKHEKVEALVKDIVSRRALNPLDIIGVIAMPGNPGHFIGVEGNRRLCALILLNDPERGPTPAAKRALLALSKQITLPSKIEVVQFDSRKDAKHWIDLRHLGPLEGQGLVGWNPTQKTRAAGEAGTNTLAVAVLDRARAGRWMDNETLPSVTTLTRYLNNREVRAALGLGHNRQLVFTHESAEVDAALRQFLLDAMPTENDEMPRVHSRSKDADRAAYARELRRRGVSPATELTTPAIPATAQPTHSTRGKVRNRPNPALRKYLVPTDFVCNAEDKNLRMLFKEMQRTPIDEHEFANVYLLRAFAERVMTLYLSKVEPGYTANSDQALVTRCSQKLDSTGKLGKLKALRTAVSDANAGHSLHSLGAAVHAGLLKDRRALISDWGNWEHALNQMLTELAKP